ncbi:MAG: polyribonucleotide nucleotidyltransferase [Saprospiraceae bacterium]|nr:polyribonucleotide nucleotidyltransferase [Saprospiraceae bacterium]MBP7699905.1 polyribonucleotide nucleotidyltransferase [Saprospiraceae bacterium]
MSNQGIRTPHSVTFNLPDGRPITIETGKLATQSDGSVVVKMGNTMLFASVVSYKEAKEGQSFFPLSVDYQEKFASTGRIPGNFFRRESKLSDYEVLISRLVDRAIRPLFPDDYMNETQIIINLISSDTDIMPDALAALAASAAMAVSDIPFAGPISEVRVAKIDGEYQVNPNKSALQRATLDMIVAATMSDICMVEGEANECSEIEMVEAIKIAHAAIKTQIQAQLDLAAKVGTKATVKREITPSPTNPEVEAKIEELCKDKIYSIAKSFSDKHTRKNAFDEVYKAAEETILAAYTEDEQAEKKPFAKKYFDKLKKKIIRQMVLDESVRLDGRSLTEIRPIWSEIDYLPSAHGSAVFTRGETQALTSCTLGTKQDEMMVDVAAELAFDKFILHYNFPAFSVGEIKPQRAPGRREVGHANLAGRSLRKMMPTENFPYTVRIVSDILESNGSSSMATVCAGSLALMDAGVKLKSPVSGIAMGMISEGGKTAILSDILGDEDALGDMDFKVTGTANGITGCQMDIKIDGMPYELLEKALEQAKQGRLHILSKMNETIDMPREDYKPHAPRIIELEVDKSFIGAIIGPGGSIIQDIQATTKTVISIEEDFERGIGKVNVAGTNKESMDKALARISQIVFVPTEGETYEGKVQSIMPFGAVIEFKGKTGLLHISEITHSRLATVEEALAVGDELKVKLLEVDKRTGKYKLSRKALIPRPPRPEGSENYGGGDRGDDRRPPRDDRRGGGDRDRRDFRDRDNNRGGGGYRSYNDDRDKNDR